MQAKEKRLTFGIVIDWISGWGDNEYYQTKIISGVADYAKENDINVICFVVGRLGSQFEWERSRNILINLVHKNHVDGLIILPTAIGLYEVDEKILSILDSFKDIPVVTFTENYGKFHCITTNNYLGVKQVVNHIVEAHNSRRFAFIGGPKNSKESRERFQAFYDTLNDNNIPYYPELTYEGDYLFDSGNAAIKHFMENNLDFDAVICANDNMAIGALTELHKQLGVIPEHISIAGFDDTDISKFHALTTVRQPFYEQAQTSAKMVHKLIKGEEVAWTIELPSEVILRSSCGCIGNEFKSNDIEINSFEYNSLEKICEDTKSKIMAELLELNKFGCNEDYEQLLSYENSIIDAFYSEFFDNLKMEFLKVWSSFVFWTILKRHEISFLQDILICIRKNVVSTIVTSDNLIKAESMFHKAGIVTSDAIQRTGASLSFLSYLQTEGMENLAENLMSHLDWKSQMDSIHKILPEYNIGKGFIAIYEDEHEPLKNSRLILAYNGENRFDVGNRGLLFDTLSILPTDIMQALGKERFNVIVMALNQGDCPIGYGVFGFEDKVNKFYEIVRHNISVALNGALLVENIKNQALNLEKQVEERTLELSEINNTLIAEIKLRKTAQEQLKRAMKELEIYNSKLKTESVRDELTGLYNRRGFMKLSEEFLNSARSNATEFLLIFGDLDGLKNINDQYGHTEGDLVIKKTAELLNQTFDHTDIISRISGDEFLLVIADAAVKDEPILRKKFRDNCNCYNNTAKKPYEISLSMGFAYFNPKAPVDFEALLKEADIALYKEKLIKNSR